MKFFLNIFIAFPFDDNESIFNVVILKLNNNYNLYYVTNNYAPPFF